MVRWNVSKIGSGNLWVWNISRKQLIFPEKWRTTSRTTEPTGVHPSSIQLSLFVSSFRCFVGAIYPTEIHGNHPAPSRGSDLSRPCHSDTASIATSALVPSRAGASCRLKGLGEDCWTKRRVERAQRAWNTCANWNGLIRFDIVCWGFRDVQCGEMFIPTLKFSQSYIHGILTIVPTLILWILDT